MSWISDVVSEGFKPRQHFDSAIDELRRLGSYSYRLLQSADVFGRPTPDPGTWGKEGGWYLFRSNVPTEVPGLWGPAVSAVVAGSTATPRSGQTTTRSGGARMFLMARS